MKKFPIQAALVVSLITFAIQAQAANLILDLTTGGAGNIVRGNSFTNDTFGWKFSLSNSINVDGLGLFDVLPNGIGGSQQVGLWNSAGTLLTSATITNASTPVASAHPNGDWLFQNVALVTLTPGNYFVGATLAPLEPFLQFNNVTSVTIPDVTLLGGFRSADNTTGLQFPNTLFSSSNAFFGPTVSFQAIPTPEPSTFVLGALGLLGLVVVARSKKNRLGLNASAA